MFETREEYLAHWVHADEELAKDLEEIQANLETARVRGTFQTGRALKVWTRFARAALKSWNKRFGKDPLNACIDVDKLGISLLEINSELSRTGKLRHLIPLKYRVDEQVLVGFELYACDSAGQETMYAFFMEHMRGLTTIPQPMIAHSKQSWACRTWVWCLGGIARRIKKQSRDGKLLFAGETHARDFVVYESHAGAWVRNSSLIEWER